MAEQERKNNGPRPKRAKLKYFFLEGNLHKALHINRSKDLIKAWNYPEGKISTFNYSTVLRRHQTAYTTKQVCEMLNRSRRTLDYALGSGMIRTPQYVYGETGHKSQYMWREEDIMELRDYLAEIHRGRPRKDGQITNNSIPSVREVRAMLNDDTILYVKQGDAFVPSWKAKEF